MIWTFDNQTERWRASTVENTAVQANFYSFETDDGPNDQLENLLADIESDAASPYEMLLADQIPSGQKKADFAVFLATLHVRTPAMINAAARGHAEMMDSVLEMLLGTRAGFDRWADRYERDIGKKLKNRSEMRSFLLDKSRYKLAVSQKIGLPIIGAADRIAPLLYAREWVVCRAAEGAFITCDHPVFRWVPRQMHGPRGDGGFKNINAEITFPLSPDRLLLIAGTDPKHPIAQLPPQAVRSANEMRAYAAERYVYSRSKDDGVAALALEHKDDRNRMTVGRPMGGDHPNVKVVRKLKKDDPADS